MKMVSMAKSDKEKMEEMKPITEPTPAERIPDYPYGLCLYLDNESLKKLGLGQGALRAGDKVIGQFVGMIVNVAADTRNNITQHRAEVQVQDLAMEPAPKEDNRADTIYNPSMPGK